MMRTVELFVEYHDSVTNSLDYAVSFAGFMNDRFLYLLKTSVTGNPKTDAVNYVKVAKADTEIATDACSLCEPDEIRTMTVSSDEGIFDSRIKMLSPNDYAIATITESVTQMDKKASANIHKRHVSSLLY